MKKDQNVFDETGVRQSPPRRELNIFLYLPVALCLFALVYFAESLASPTREITLILASAFITLTLVLLGKGYKNAAMAQVLGIVLAIVFFLVQGLTMGYSLIGIFNYGRAFQITLVWSIGFITLILARLFTIGKGDTQEKRQSFRQAFHFSSVVLLSVYLGLLILLFIGQRQADIDGSRSINLRPFQGAFAIYWPHIRSGNFDEDIFTQFFGNLLIFTPLGFYLCIYGKKLRWFGILIFPVLLAGTIEITQYIFNTGKSDIDDFWMNVVGFWLGCLLYLLLGFIRSLLTRGREKQIFY